MRILIAGAGLGSVIAECLVRTGFEHITVIDGDVVDITNLNRQNYVATDAGQPKTHVLRKRLLAINPSANINSLLLYLDKDNITKCIGEYDVAINAIDFTSDAPFLFDRVCARAGIPVLHPYNLGWAACLCVVSPQGPFLESIQADYQRFEISFVSYLIAELNKQGVDTVWLRDLFQRYREEENAVPPPQLSVASHLVSALCTKAICMLATDREVNFFPELNYLSV